MNLLPPTLVPAPVRIIGTGLIGGSLGLALTTAGVDVQVEDVSPGTTALAVEMGVGSVAGPDSPDPALVLVAAPPDVTAAIVARALREWPDALVADVASVKGEILAQLRQQCTPIELTRYVGAHPMAGREVSGVIAAQGDLFTGRPFVVVPHSGTKPEAVTTMRALGTELGSVVRVMDASAHDEAVAHVSHVPQVMASLLAATLLEPDAAALDLAGQGVRDATRIADSDPRLWVEILGANAAAVAPVLDSIRDRLGDVIEALDACRAEARDAAPSAPGNGPVPRRTVASVIADGNRGVSRIPGKHGGAGDDFATLVVVIPDRPGALASLLAAIQEIGVNLEDLHLEHALGRRVGLTHIAVEQEHEEHLTQELITRGWTVAGR